MNLQPLGLPDSSASWPEFVANSADAGLARAQELMSQLKDGSPRTAIEVLEIWNDIDLALGRASGLMVVTSSVHPDESVRTLSRDREQEISRIMTGRGLDRDLYDVMAAIDTTSLDAEATRVVEMSLRDFRRSGVDQPEAARTRLRDIAERITELGQDFAKNIVESDRSITVTPDELDGLPADFIDAHPLDADGHIRLTTDYPDVIPVRTFATNPATRRAIMGEFLNRGWPDNDSVLIELLTLRDERARLLGYADWPSYDAEVKMIGSGPAIEEFIDRVTAMAEPSGRRDLDVLVARRQVDDPDATGLDSADSYYYSEIVRRENFDVDAQEVRRYFNFALVRAGLLDVTGRLFGVEYREVADAPVWHEEVTVYDVHAVGGDRIGRIYLDLHPRAGKYSHAAQFDLVHGITDRQLPEGVLVCNFPRGLMEHSDVVTLFHEFGHLVHHVLAGNQRWARFSGVATEWDFVEAPSQMLEEWAWSHDILRTFAIDETGRQIPAELVDRMRAAHEFGKGLSTRTQMYFAAMSYFLHRDTPTDITAMTAALQEKYDLLDTVPGAHFHASFGHLNGYTSSYYTYQWSLVIAKDMFSAFDSTDLFDEKVAGHYRDEILVPGGSGDAADLVASFLDRPYSLDAYSDWLLASE